MESSSSLQPPPYSPGDKKMRDNDFNFKANNSKSDIGCNQIFNPMGDPKRF